MLVHRVRGHHLGIPGNDATLFPGSIMGNCSQHSRNTALLPYPLPDVLLNKVARAILTLSCVFLPRGWTRGMVYVHTITSLCIEKKQDLTENVTVEL